MRIPPALLLVLAAGLAAAPALAHGGQTTQVKTEGPYKVTWHTYTFLTDDEYARFAWEVDNASDGGDAHLASAPTAAFVFRDGDGATVDSSIEDLEQDEGSPGLWSVSVLIPPHTGELEVTLDLPEADVTFSQSVQTLTPQNGDGGDGADGGNDAPGVGVTLTAVALVAAAGVVARRR